MTNPSEPIEYFLVDANSCVKHHSEVIVETPVSLTVNGEFWLTFMCTPIDLEALAVGFLYNENFIQDASEIADVRLCAAGDNVDVWLHHPVEKPATWSKTSGCTGGVTSVTPEKGALSASPGRNHNGCHLNPKQVSELTKVLAISQDLYRKAGGVHTSVLTDNKSVYIMAEDIGRHNSLDKIAGKCLLENIDTPRCILLTTGRISSEMLQKSNRIGATIVISRTSPSSLSVSLAEEFGITLIGYARPDRFRVYTHPERIVVQPGEAVQNRPEVSAPAIQPDP